MKERHSNLKSQCDTVGWNASPPHLLEMLSGRKLKEGRWKFDRAVFLFSSCFRAGEEEQQQAQSKKGLKKQQKEAEKAAKKAEKQAKLVRRDKPAVFWTSIVLQIPDLTNLFIYSNSPMIRF